MAKFVMECPRCGKYVEAKTGFFARKKIDCACGQQNITSNFCPNCGAKKPAEDNGWICPDCGQKEIKTNFCPNCGHKKGE